MDRRSFLRSSCLGCAGLIGLGALSGCSTLPIVKGPPEPGALRLARTAFAESEMVIVRDRRLPFDVLVQKHGDGYRALYLRCTHRDQPLTATKGGLYCSAHGSRFGMDGAVQVGPAERPLIVLPVTATGSDLLISLTPLH